MIFCGIFDGHGAWGKEIAKMISKFFPYLLLCSWQEELNHYPSRDKKLPLVDVWLQSYTKACAAMDMEIKHNRSLDSFFSGSTALTVIIQVCIEN